VELTEDEVSQVKGGGESYTTGKWFVADSFSFGVEREMKESGE